MPLIAAKQGLNPHADGIGWLVPRSQVSFIVRPYPHVVNPTNFDVF